MKKLRQTQSGFGHVVLLGAVVVIAVIGFAGWRIFSQSGDDSGQQTSATSQQNRDKITAAEPMLSLQNLGLASFDSIDITNQAVRDYSSQGLKGFYIFGDPLSGGRTNPNFEYASVKAGTKVISAIDGIVAFIQEQPDSKDYEVFVQPKDGSTWTVGYDHITNVAATKGADIKAGDVIGEPAVQNNGLRRFEIQINKDEAGATTHYCPSVLLADSAKSKWLAELTMMQNSWESTTGLDLYDLAAQSPVGCLKETMTPSEAEGR